MKILVAGASGALGRRLVPILVARGHEVAGMTRTPAKADALRRLGAEPIVADALDPNAVADAVARHEPEIIVNELTALSGSLDLRNLDRTFAETNRLRVEATDHLLAAGRAVGVRRFVAQSYAGWTFGAGGPNVNPEDAPLDADPLPGMSETLAAISHLEEAVTGADWTEGVVLRYGGFYGPGTSFAPEGGEHVDAIRKRKFPIVGGGDGVWSFIHVDDAAEATAIAAERARRGIYQIVDDTPVPVRVWLPAVADALGAKRPRRVPRWLGRLLAGEAATFMMTEVRGASNAKAKRELGWSPRYPSVQETVAGWVA